eukprot:scaffold1217_cov21-Cyclotella_meneghiniana.AAC.2
MVDRSTGVLRVERVLCEVSSLGHQLGLACVTQLGQHILRSYKNTTYRDDGDDDASIAGLIMSADTLPYELDLCQLFDTRKKNWKKALLPKLGGNAH